MNRSYFATVVKMDEGFLLDTAGVSVQDRAALLPVLLDIWENSPVQWITVVFPTSFHGILTVGDLVGKTVNAAL